MLTAAIFMVTLLAYLFVTRKSSGKWLNILVFFYHSLFSAAFLWLFLEEGSDFSYYYELAVADEGPDFGFGTAFVIRATRLLSMHGSLDLIQTSLIYNLIGALGLSFLFERLRQLKSGTHPAMAYIPALLVFLPGLSFWTSAIGKDSLSFFAIGAVLLGISAPRKHLLLTLTGLVLLFMVRPHIGSVMAASIIVAAMTSRAFALRYKAIMLIGGIAAALYILPLALSYVGLPPSLSMAELAQYISDRQELNQGQAASFDISGLPLPLAVFAFLFRPLFDVAGFAGTMASIENLILLVMFVLLTVPALLKAGREPTFEVRTNFLFATLTVLMLATTIANSGIAVRQKTMVLPSILVLTALGISTRSRRAQQSARHTVHASHPA